MKFFPIFIILGPFALNCFSIIFSLYAIINYKSLKQFKILNKKIIIIFFSFVVLIFPFESLVKLQLTLFVPPVNSGNFVQDLNIL